MRALTSLPLKVLTILGRKLRDTPLGRSVLLIRIHDMLSIWLYRSNEAEVGPFHIRLDPRDRVIAKKLALYGGYEVQEISLLCSLVKPGDNVLDVGANIGLHSLYLSRAVGPQGRVIAVEPDPDNLALLHANIEANGCANVMVLPCAFGEESGYIELFQVDDNRGNLSFADLGRTGRSVSVPVRRGDQALEELQMRPTLAKIDVEGAEPLVVSGLGCWRPSVLLFEFVPQFIRELGREPLGFLESVVAEGYTLELVDPENGALELGTPFEIMARADRIGANYNILAVRCGKS